MTISATFLFFIGLAYVTGSIPFGKLIGKYYDVDIQKHGSGNIGFANVVRVLGWKAGLFVLPADILKGTIPLIIAKHYLNLDQELAVALAAVLGHIFPIWLRFRGGKGIATGLGVTLVLCPIAAILGIIAYGLIFILFRKSAPSSITATLCMPFFCLAFYPNCVLFYVGLAILTIWTHRDNIQQLLKEVPDVA